jgi:hypothetical protein
MEIVKKEEPIYLHYGNVLRFQCIAVMLFNVLLYVNVETDCSESVTMESVGRGESIYLNYGISMQCCVTLTM